MSRRRVIQQGNEAIVRNSIAYQHYYNYFKNLAINMYEWEGLPNSIDARYLELTLFEKGFVLYFNDPIIGDLALSTTLGGDLQVYNLPTDYTAYASNGYNARRTAEDSVLIFDNYLHTTKHLSVDMFALKLYNIDRTFDINLNAQKTPILIRCPEDKKLALKNVYKNYVGNEPVIFAYDDFDPDSLAVLKTDAPYLLDKLLLEKNKVWNEAMTFLGIENANTDKKERLIVDEVEANDGQVGMSKLIGLKARREAAEKINRMFGTVITVKYSLAIGQQKEGEQNGISNTGD